MFDVRKPIPHALKDPKQLGDFLQKYHIMPYFGTLQETSHSTLRLIEDLSELSFSHRAAIRSVCDFAFGTGIAFTDAPIPGLDLGEVAEPLDRAAQLATAQRLGKYGITPTQILQLTWELEKSLRDSGNAYLHIKHMVVGGSERVFFSVIDYTEAAYLASKPNENRHIIATEEWSENWWRIKRPLIVKSSDINTEFRYTKRAKGNTSETILHIKTKNDRSSWYGRTNMVPAFNWMFAEYSQSELAAKVSKTEMVAKLIAIFEEVNPQRKKSPAPQPKKDNKGGPSNGAGQSGFTKRMKALKKLSTNNSDFGDAESIVGIEYPFGQQRPYIEKLDISRDVAHPQMVLNQAKSIIYSLNGWYPQLSGANEVKSSIGGNMIIDLFVVANSATVEPLQTFWENTWSVIFGNLSELVGDDLTTGIQFNRKIPKLVESLRDESSNGNNVVAVAGDS